MDYQNLLYDPIYGVIGVPAVLRMGSSLGNVDVTAIDKTVGVVVSQGVDLQTDSPAATIRAAELIAAGIGLENLDGRTLTLNGVDWRISSHHLNPSPRGESDGEVYLILDGGLG